MACGERQEMTVETDAIPAMQMWLVVSVGGQTAAGDPKPQWFADYGDAWYEARRRLGVERLHRKKHGRHQRFNFGPDEGKRIYQGVERRAEWAEDYQAATARRAPLGGSGGVTIYQMITVGIGPGVPTE